MPYEDKRIAVQQSLDKVTVRWKNLLQRFVLPARWIGLVAVTGKVTVRWKNLLQRLPVLPARWIGLVAVTGLVAYTFILRFLHLANGNHYYVLSPDSYFFHWMSGRFMAGLDVPADAPIGAIKIFPLHSGLTYPLTYIAKAFSGVFGLSSADALDLVCKLVPPILGILSLLLIYFVASRLCDRRVGLCSAFTWAAINHSVFIGAAGYLDRDGLSVLLLTIGVFLFYLTKHIHIRIGNRDVSWLLTGLGVLIIEGLLYLEWSFVGPVLLMAVVTAYFTIKTLLGYESRLRTEPSVIRRLSSSLSEANGLCFAVIILGNLIMVAANTRMASFVFHFGGMVVQQTGESGIAEMQGLSLGHIFGFGFFLILIAFGLYRVWKTRNDAMIFFTTWFLSLMILSLFANRVVLFAVPAACLLSGVGLAFLWQKMKHGGSQSLKKGGVAVLLLMIILLSFFQAYNQGSNPFVAMNKDWQDAMAYVRDNTPEDAIILSQWGVGYWILDQGQRKPVVDNGFYGWDYNRLYDIGSIYGSNEPSDVVKIMAKYNAGYLIFSELDTYSYQTILGWAELEEKYKGFDGFPDDLLVSRALNGQFESGGGLEVAYRSLPDSEVVILTTTSSTEP
ncbi:hypothetical protein ACFLXV_00665 [Chloroflexota bacterium]